MSIFNLRPAVAKDISAMLKGLHSALRDSIFHNRCFPASDPATHQQYVNWIDNSMNDPASHIVVAEEANPPTGDRAPIAGWARWVRRPGAEPNAEPMVMVFSEDMFPAGGNPRLAASFFQANFDAMVKATGGSSVWFLSMLIVPEESEGRGVDGELMRYGVQKADGEKWPAFGNATPEKKSFYEDHGFQMVDTHEFDGGLTTHHMKREAIE
ncbi:hypothetical protein QQS21_008559 [Conoideocrella luteorostrata]|uniref:N-acetyltransferase domain-containing protein n=1 Tax=Conoideocrella luteorostrata TaxID=1105319 RepID=A0AAJ0FR39_9HYPO|nr:hypothetical protein QQS21_008559 [Conoideocrella luteorostrata]